MATSYSCRGKPPTTIGAEELNCRVRDGNGCDLFAIATRLIELVRSKPDKTDIIIGEIEFHFSSFHKSGESSLFTF